MFINNVVSKLLIAYPGKQYFDRDHTLLSVASAYTYMAITGFDDLMKFDESYDEHKEIPDYETEVAEKEGLPLLETVFCDQPVQNVSGHTLRVNSSSYLFNPKIDLGRHYPGIDETINFDELYLPDLEIVECSGLEVEVGIVLDCLKSFYRSHGWKAYLFDGILKKGLAPTMKNSRLESINVYDAHELREVAKEFGYHEENLYFDMKR